MDTCDGSPSWRAGRGNPSLSASKKRRPRASSPPTPRETPDDHDTAHVPFLRTASAVVVVVALVVFLVGGPVRAEEPTSISARLGVLARMLLGIALAVVGRRILRRRTRAGRPRARTRPKQSPSAAGRGAVPVC
jgi:hypothetical protein